MEATGILSPSHTFAYPGLGFCRPRLQFNALPTLERLNLSRASLFRGIQVSEAPKSDSERDSPFGSAAHSFWI